MDARAWQPIVDRLRAKADWPCVYLQVPVIPKRGACNAALDPPNDWCDLCAMKFTADAIVAGQPSLSPSGGPGACDMTTPAVTPPGRLSREQREQIRARFEQLGGMVDDDAAALLADLDARDALLAEAPELIERLRHYMGIQDGTIEMRHVPCPRCNGRGYHHGFGEHGHDPDWCEQCGGPGELLHPDDNGDPTELVTQAADLLSRLLPDAQEAGR